MQYKDTNRSGSCYLLIMGVFLAIMTLVGCALSQPNVLGDESVLSDINPTVTETVSVLVSATPPSVPPTATSSVTPLPSAIPTATNTVTPLPSNTPTTTFTPVPTLTPLPTIDSKQRGQVYTELIRSNGDCILPCWWGIELGITSIEYVEQLYTSLDASLTTRDFENGVSRVTALFIDPQIEDGTQVRHTFFAQDDIVTEALIEIVSHPDYQIRPILERLGQPSEIWMWTIPEPREGILPSRFRLYFPERGVFVLYATGGVKNGDVVNVCFDGPGGVILLLWNPAIWDPDSTKGIVDRSNEGGSAFTLEGYPIEEVSNWDTEQFYTILTDPTRSECLETPSDLWAAP